MEISPAGSEGIKKVRLPRERIRVSSLMALSRFSKRTVVANSKRSDASDRRSDIQVFTASRASMLRSGSLIALANV